MTDFEDISNNPYIPKPEQYFEEYNKSIEENFDNQSLKYSEATYKLFETHQGKEWLRMTKELLGDQFVDLESVNAPLHLAAKQGTRLLILTIEQHIVAFKQHLEAK